MKSKLIFQADQETRKNSNSFRIIILSALLLAALLQTITILRSPLIQTDGFVFINMARKMVSDPVAAIRSFDQHPGYPFLIIVGKLCLGSFEKDQQVDAWILGARVFPWICGILCVLMVALITRLVFNERIACIAAFFFTAIPLPRQNAADALSDNPALFFYLTATWLLIEGITRRKIILLSGCAFASSLAYLVRPEGLSVMIIATAILCILAFRSEYRRFAISGLLAVLLVTAVFSSPFIIVKGSLTGKKNPLSLFTKFFNSSGRVNKETISFKQPGKSPGKNPASGQPAKVTPPGQSPEKNPAPGQPAKVKQPGQSPEKNPASGQSAKVTPPGQSYLYGFLDMLNEFVRHGMYYFFLLPLILGIFFYRKDKEKRIQHRIVTALAGFHVFLLVLLVLIANYVGYRHVLILSALCMVWIGAGTVVLSKQIHKAIKRFRPTATRLSPNLVMCLLVAAIVCSFLPKDIRQLHKSRNSLLKTAKYIRSNTQPDARILTTSEYILFYSNRDGRTVSSLQENISAVKDAETKKPYDLVVIEGERYQKKEDLLNQAKRYYVEKTIPGISGGKRDLIILEPRNKS